MILPVMRVDADAASPSETECPGTFIKDDLSSTASLEKRTDHWASNGFFEEIPSTG
jgi:hypothetical protein